LNPLRGKNFHSPKYFTVQDSEKHYLMNYPRFQSEKRNYN
jgi:hypothetical protein